ncbi:MAG: hypothetical protein ACR2QA_16555 [Solirubrobacteraceae bacterium]
MVWRRRSRAAGGERRPGTGRPSPALVVASLALAVALGGTSYAALALPPASVGTSQLRGGAVTTAKLAARAITSAKLARGAVTSASLARDAVRNANVRAGAGVSIVYRSGGAQIAANSQRAVYTACPPGTNAVGGGETPDDPLHVFLVYAGPFDRRAQSNSGPADSWVADVVNTDGSHAHNFSVYATCIRAGAVR